MFQMITHSAHAQNIFDFYLDELGSCAFGGSPASISPSQDQTAFNFLLSFFMFVLLDVQWRLERLSNHCPHGEKKMGHLKGK